MRRFVVPLSLGVLAAAAQPSYGWWIFHHAHHPHFHHAHPAPGRATPAVAAPLVVGLPGGITLDLNGQILRDRAEAARGGAGTPAAAPAPVPAEVTASLGRIETTLTAENGSVDKLNALIAKVNEKQPDGKKLAPVDKGPKAAAVKTTTTTTPPGTTPPAKPPVGKPGGTTESGAPE